ncbi:hypothetical protein F2Q70_00042191 [Brassica cretica]|uniref:Uncharacterized protein n=1 Tax=Brassica cretica TaxID=69181 RepID=A0A8S9MBU3_BRACR|nr:hypothetical protein F2Q70_00042191 [Brassica cretica]KAF2617500.1 hypothetical protein F2Q68_00042850 [Brassica cretica]
MKYEEYMQEQKEKKNLPGVRFKKPKKILKKRSCSFSDCFKRSNNCPRECKVCDGTFFPELRMKAKTWLTTHFKRLWVRADLARNGIFDYEKLKKTWNMRMVDQSEKCKESVMESKKEEEAIELKLKKARFCFCKKQRKDCGRKITVSPTTLV